MRAPPRASFRSLQGGRREGGPLPLTPVACAVPQPSRTSFPSVGRVRRPPRVVGRGRPARTARGAVAGGCRASLRRQGHVLSPQCHRRIMVAVAVSTRSLLLTDRAAGFRQLAGGSSEPKTLLPRLSLPRRARACSSCRLLSRQKAVLRTSSPTLSGFFLSRNRRKTLSLISSDAIPPQTQDEVSIRRRENASDPLSPHDKERTVPESVHRGRAGLSPGPRPWANRDRGSRHGPNSNAPANNNENSSNDSRRTATRLP